MGIWVLLQKMFLLVPIRFLPNLLLSMLVSQRFKKAHDGMEV